MGNEVRHFFIDTYLDFVHSPFLCKTMNLKHATARVSTGIDIHYVSAGNKSNPCIVLIHGYVVVSIFTVTTALEDRDYIS